MDYKEPKHVELTDDEAKWNDQIPSTPGGTEWSQVADSMEALCKSLLKRRALPEIRLRVFADPNFAETRAKSPKQVFESNGTWGDEIYRHPHFIFGTAGNYRYRLKLAVCNEPGPRRNRLFPLVGENRHLAIVPDTP